MLQGTWCAGSGRRLGQLGKRDPGQDRALNAGETEPERRPAAACRTGFPAHSPPGAVVLGAAAALAGVAPLAAPPGRTVCAKSSSNLAQVRGCSVSCLRSSRGAASPGAKSGFSETVRPALSSAGAPVLGVAAHSPLWLGGAARPACTSVRTCVRILLPTRGRGSRLLGAAAASRTKENRCALRARF